MDINTQWGEFCNRPFPDDLAGVEIDGICITSLDSAAAGCISTYVDNGGCLDSERIRVLQTCSNELERINPLIRDDSRYFNKLAELIHGVLAEIHQ